VGAVTNAGRIAEQNGGTMPRGPRELEARFLFNEPIMARLKSLRKKYEAPAAGGGRYKGEASQKQSQKNGSEDPPLQLQRKVIDGDVAARLKSGPPEMEWSRAAINSSRAAINSGRRARESDGGAIKSGATTFSTASMIAAFFVLLSFGAVTTRGYGSGEQGVKAAEQAYEASEYPKAAQLLQAAASAQPENAEIQLLLTKTHLELQQYEAAIKSAEKAVALAPNSSVYHEWLGRAYGERADHASFLSALGFAKKTRKEFETAVELDGKNYTARQAVIEFDCAAPGMAGGGEDKALPEIAQMAALDAAEGHYAAGNCRRQKKDFAAADAEFSKALQGDLKSVERVFDIGDYAVRHEEPAMLTAVANLGARLAPRDPRVWFYRAVACVLEKRNAVEAQKALDEYIEVAPARSGYPRISTAHYWLGKLFENQGNETSARSEYEIAWSQDPKNKNAQEALKRLKKG
jgi:tetratricopeptide (TPR) repeat protein